MYQFIVTTRSSGTCVGTGNSRWSGAGATVGDISSMALASNTGTNKWASRAVVALQLAAWSAVGIVLLEKGVTSLQKNPPPRTPHLNVSQAITTPASSSNPPDSRILNDSKRIERLSSEKEPEPLSVLSIDGSEDIDAPPSPGGLEQFEDSNSSWGKSLTPEQEPRGSSGGVDKPAIGPQEQLEQTNRKIVNDATTKNQVNDWAEKNSDKKDIYLGRYVAPNVHKDTKQVQEKTGEEDRDDASSAKMWDNPVTIKVLMDNLEERRWENRKHLRVARVNGAGGAAAAVAMVAVGAIMLILGPAVIILRALDERRQERRFLKLSREEDLPPSYEEATSELDQAPTYSSLNLDTLLPDSSSPNANHSENTCFHPNCRRDSCYCC